MLTSTALVYSSACLGGQVPRQNNVTTPAAAPLASACEYSKFAALLPVFLLQSLLLLASVTLNLALGLRLRRSKVTAEVKDTGELQDGDEWRETGGDCDECRAGRPRLPSYRVSQRSRKITTASARTQADPQTAHYWVGHRCGTAIMIEGGASQLLAVVIACGANQLQREEATRPTSFMVYHISLKQIQGVS